MINAGAIANGTYKVAAAKIASLISRTMEWQQRVTGELEINRIVYHAENIGGHRNRALAGCCGRLRSLIPSEPVVQDYFRMFYRCHDGKPFHGRNPGQ